MHVVAVHVDEKLDAGHVGVGEFVEEKVGGVEVVQQHRARLVEFTLCDEIDEPVVEGALPTRVLGGAAGTAQLAPHFADQVEGVECVRR